MSSDAKGYGLDRAAFDALLLQHVEPAARFAVRLCGNVHDGEDVAHDAIVGAASSWRSFAGCSSFRTWLFQIVLNAFRDWSRREAVRRRSVATVERSFDASEALAERELASKIGRLISALPARQREVIVLITCEAFSPADVASMLSISEQNVRTTLHHARATLKEQLREYFPSPRAAES